MALPSPTLLLQLALCTYALGVVGSLLALRREKIANLVGFGFATLAGALGIGAGVLGLTSGVGDSRAAFELWPSLIPYLKLTVKLDPLGAFFVLIISVLAVALSVYSFGYVRGFYGRSLKLRQVSAGGCAACEADTNVLGTIGWDLGRFGIQFVASPRHADGLLITGPVSKNMELALKKTYAAVPEPKIVIAVGACAIAGGPFVGHPQVHNGAGVLVPVGLYIPGCPPHPLTILDELLRLLGRLEDSERRS
jgi:Ni,Fe-hydrogenase III small subunit